MATPRHAAKQPAASAASGAPAPHAPRDAASTGRDVPLQGAELFAERVAALGLRVELPRAPAGGCDRHPSTPAPGPATKPGNPLGSGPGPPGELPAFFGTAGPGSGDLLDFELEPGSAAASPNSDDLAAECSASLSLSSPDSAARSALGLSPGQGCDLEPAAEGWQAVPAVQAALLPRQALKLLVAGCTPERVACYDPAWRGALFLEYLGFRLRGRSRYRFAAHSPDPSPSPGSTPRSPAQWHRSAGGGGSGTAEMRFGNGESGADARVGASPGGLGFEEGRGCSSHSTGEPEGSNGALEGSCAVASAQRPSPAGGAGDGGDWGCDGSAAAPLGAGAGASEQHLSSAEGGGSGSTENYGGSSAVPLESSTVVTVQRPSPAAPSAGSGGATRSGRRAASAPAAGAAPCPGASAASPAQPCALAPPQQDEGLARPLQAGAAQSGGAGGAAADQGPVRQEGAHALVTLQAPGGKPAAKHRRPPLRVRRAAKTLAAGADPGDALALALTPAAGSSRAVVQAGESGETPAAAPPAVALAEEPPALRHAMSEAASACTLPAGLGQGAGAPAGRPDAHSAPVEPGRGVSLPGASEPEHVHGGALVPSAPSTTLLRPGQGLERGCSRAVQGTCGEEEALPVAAAAEQRRPGWLPMPLLDDHMLATDVPAVLSAKADGAPGVTAVAEVATAEALPPAGVPSGREVVFTTPQPASAGGSARTPRGAEAESVHERGQPRGPRDAAPPLVPLPEHIVAGLQEADGADAAQACGAPRPWALHSLVVKHLCCLPIMSLLHVCGKDVDIPHSCALLRLLSSISCTERCQQLDVPLRAMPSS